MNLSLTAFTLLALCCWTTSGAGSPFGVKPQAISPVRSGPTDSSFPQGLANPAELTNSPLQARSPCRWLKNKIKGCFQPPPPRGRGRVVLDNYRTQEMMVLSQEAQDRDHGRIGIGGVRPAWACKSRKTCVHAYSHRFEPPPPQSDEDE